MNTKVLALLFAIVILGGGAYYFLDTGVSGRSEEIADTSPSTVSGMRAGENMVIVSEQRPGSIVVGTVVLAASGYLVIHEDKDDGPGAILGASSLLPAGQSANITVRLSRASQDGETLHAILHFEKGGNTTFSAAEDTPVGSSLGGPISAWFEVSKDAPSETPVSI